MKSLLLLSVLFLFACTHPKTRAHNETSIPQKTHNVDDVSSFECHQNNLFKSLDLNIDVKRFVKKDELFDSCIVRILLTNRIDQEFIDSLYLSSVFYHPIMFKNCNEVLSYSTGLNINKEIVDNYYGDVVVADFNFDHKEDLAIINDSGGNGGPLYSFFLQDADQKFKLNTFLRDSMAFFPSTIDPQKRTLTTYAHAGNCWLGEHIFVFNEKTGKWKTKSKRLIDICDEE